MERRKDDRGVEWREDARGGEWEWRGGGVGRYEQMRGRGT